MKRTAIMKLNEEELKLLFPYIKYKKNKHLNWVYFIPYTSTSYEMILDDPELVEMMLKIINDRLVGIDFDFVEMIDYYFDTHLQTFFIRCEIYDDDVNQNYKSVIYQKFLQPDNKNSLNQL
jgi:hypothetical protein